VTQVGAASTGLTATAILGNASIVDVTAKATWISGSPGVASVVGGLVTPLAAGTVVVTASYGGQSAQRVVLVQAASVTAQSVVLNPSAVQIPIGLVQRFTVIAYYSDQTPHEVTSQATEWASSDVNVVRVDALGRATAVGAGNATVTCDYSFGGITRQGSAQLTVLADTIQSLQIFPQTNTVATGFTVSFAARGSYGTGERDITSNVTKWTADPPILVFGDNSIGRPAHVATAVGLGVTKVTASVGTLTSNTVEITVSPGGAVLADLIITDESQPLRLQKTGPSSGLTAMAVYSDGRREDVTGKVAWICDCALPDDGTGRGKVIVDVSTTGVVVPLELGSGLISVRYYGHVAARSVIVSPPSLQMSHSLMMGLVMPLQITRSPRQLALTASFFDGTSQDIAVNAGTTWSIQDPTIATVYAGLLAPVKVGETTVFAEYAGATINRTVRVTAPMLSISNGPELVVIMTRPPQKLALLATFDDGTTQDVSTLATWNSSDTTFASVIAGPSLTGGTVSPVSPGTPTITANYGTASAVRSVRVAAPSLTLVEVCPLSMDLVQPVPQTRQLTLLATYPDGSSSEYVTSRAIWLSSAPENARVVSGPSPSGGTVTALNRGTATLSVSFGGSTIACDINVGSPTLALSDAPQLNIQVNRPARKLTLFATIGGVQQDVSAQASWTSDSPNVAMVAAGPSADGGTVSAVAPGSTIVRASYSGATVTRNVAVSGPNLTISLGPKLYLQTTRAGVILSAQAVYLDGFVETVTTSGKWLSDNGTVTVTSTSSGILVSPYAIGSANVKLEYAGATATLPVSVTAPRIVISNNPKLVLPLIVGSSQPLTLNAYYSDGATADVTQDALTSWASNNNTIATVGASGIGGGIVSPVNVGTTYVTAAFGGATARLDVQVIAYNVTLLGLAIAPTSVNLGEGLTVAFAATATFSDQSTQDVTSAVSPWVSTNTNVVSIDSKGVATGLAGGGGLISNITASYTLGGVTKQATAIVSVLKLNSIAVIPSATTVPKGLTVYFTAMGYYTTLGAKDLTASVAWTPTGNYLSFGVTGSTRNIATAIAPGAATVTAAFANVSSPAVTITVAPAAIVTLAIRASTPLTAICSTPIPVGLVCLWEVWGTFTDNTSLNVSGDVTWISTNAAAASFLGKTTAGNLLKANAQGTTAVSAINGVISSNPVTVTVNTATLGSNLITVNAVSEVIHFPIGQSQQYTASAIYSDSVTYDLSRTVTWDVVHTPTNTISVVPAIASVTTGLVTGNATTWGLNPTGTLYTDCAQTMATLPSATSAFQFACIP
jgi:hypothetical protein